MSKRTILNGKRRSNYIPHTNLPTTPTYDEDQLIDRILDLMSNECWNEAKFMLSTCCFSDRAAILELMNEN